MLESIQTVCVHALYLRNTAILYQGACAETLVQIMISLDLSKALHSMERKTAVISTKTVVMRSLGSAVTLLVLTDCIVSVCLSLSVSVSVCVCVCLSLSLCLSVCLSVCLSLDNDRETDR